MWPGREWIWVTYMHLGLPRARSHTYPQQQGQRFPEAERELDPVLLHLAEARDAAPALIDVPVMFCFVLGVRFDRSVQLPWTAHMPVGAVHGPVIRIVGL